MTKRHKTLTITLACLLSLGIAIMLLAGSVETKYLDFRTCPYEVMITHSTGPDIIAYKVRVKDSLYHFTCPIDQFAHTMQTAGKCSPINYVTEFPAFFHKHIGYGVPIEGDSIFESHLLSALNPTPVYADIDSLFETSTGIKQILQQVTRPMDGDTQTLILTHGEHKDPQKEDYIICRLFEMGIYFFRDCLSGYLMVSTNSIGLKGTQWDLTEAEFLDIPLSDWKAALQALCPKKHKEE